MTSMERSPAALWRRTGHGVSVLPSDDSTVVALEGIHAAIWEALDRPRCLADLEEPVAGQPGAGKAVAGWDVLDQALRFLVGAGVVQGSDEPESGAE